MDWKVPFRPATAKSRVPGLRRRRAFLRAAAPRRPRSRKRMPLRLAQTQRHRPVVVDHSNRRSAVASFTRAQTVCCAAVGFYADRSADRERHRSGPGSYRITELSGADQEGQSRRSAIVHDGSGAARSTVPARCSRVCVHRDDAWLRSDTCRRRAALHDQYRGACRSTACVHDYGDSNRCAAPRWRPDDQ